MSHASRSDRGFTLIEATISMTLLLVVLVLSLSFLFSMRAFAERQELFALPRQNARRAVDYLSEAVKAATDLNYVQGNPNALPIWYRKGGVPTQATWNNVQDPNLADVNTDIITLGRADNPRRIMFDNWNGPGDMAGASAATIVFREGCNNDQVNLQMFADATGCHDDATGAPCVAPANLNISSVNSDVLTAIDSVGNWAFFQITDYQGCVPTCCPNAIWSVVINPGGSDGINPPSYRGVTLPCSIAGGLRFFAYRVRDGQLEQKQRMFDPNLDNPGAASWNQLLDNIEDLQVAWLYEDGTIWNDSPAHRLTTTNEVPSQDGVGGATRDIVDVRGVRLSITARAPREVPNQVFARYLRPASEDRVAATAQDRRFHYRLTSTIMLRNRMLGN